MEYELLQDLPDEKLSLIAAFFLIELWPFYYRLSQREREIYDEAAYQLELHGKVLLRHTLWLSICYEFLFGAELAKEVQAILGKTEVK